MKDAVIKRILIVEDDPRVSELLVRGLGEQGFDIIATYDGKEAEKLTLVNDYDLVVTDIMLPGMTGVEFCRRLKSRNSDLPVVMLTALGDTDDKLDGFDAGADDYMVKPFELRELIARINVLLKRYQKGKKENKLTYADLEIDLLTKEVKRSGVTIGLSPKEFNLMAYLVKNSERVLSRSEIAENVWDTHFDTGTNFIDVYINYLRKKIDRDFDVKLIHTKSGMGFILRSES